MLYKFEYEYTDFTRNRVKDVLAYYYSWCSYWAISSHMILQTSRNMSDTCSKRYKINNIIIKIVIYLIFKSGILMILFLSWLQFICLPPEAELRPDAKYYNDIRKLYFQIYIIIQSVTDYIDSQVIANPKQVKNIIVNLQ